MPGADYPKEINKYLIKHIKTLGYKYTEDDTGNIIVNIPATAGYSKVPRVILQSHTGAASAFGIATILRIISNPNPRGALRILFTVDDDGDMTGAKHLNPKKNLNGDILISFDGGSSGTIVTSAPGGTVLKSSMNVQTSEPKQKRAYVIAASGFETRRPTLGQESLGDPIKIIAEVLTAVRGGGIQYELASFKGGTDAFHLPGEAVAVVVVGDYEMIQFRKIFGGIKEEYLSLFEDDTIDISMIETTMPKTVVSNDDTGAILTHLYGLITSNIDDINGEASLYLSGIDLTPLTFNCEATLYCTDSGDMNRLTLQQKELEKLSGIALDEALIIPGFVIPDDSPYTERMSSAYRIASGGEPEIGSFQEISELGFLHELNPDLPIISLGVSITDPGLPQESVSKKGISVPANTVLAYQQALADIK
jgi:dipeptidase D